MRYKFKFWHLVVAVIALLILYNGGYLGFLGAMTVGQEEPGWFPYATSTVDVSGNTYWDFYKTVWAPNMVWVSSPLTDLGVSSTDYLLEIQRADSVQTFGGKNFKTMICPLCFAKQPSGMECHTVEIYISGNFITPIGGNNEIAGNSYCRAYDESGNLIMDRSGRWYSFEIKHSVLNPANFVVYIDGINRGAYSMADPIIRIQDPWGVFVMMNPQYKPIFSCEVGPNQLLAYEMFSEGDISLFSTSYPVDHLCLDHPAVLYDKASGGSTTTAEIYQIMIEGGTYPIPDGKIIGIFYVMNNPGSLSVSCPKEAYNINTKRCANITGLMTICSTGDFDPAYGTCVVTIYNVMCPYGGRYDSAQNMCIYNPPIQYICAYGDYMSDKGRCEYTSAIPGECPATHPDYPKIVYTWDPTAKVCYSVPASQILCPPFYGYDSVKEKCIMHAETAADCKNSDAVFADGVCSVDIVSTPICPKNGYLTPDLSKCIYEPDSGHNCVQGGGYDEATGKCIVEPDYDYLCLKGKYTIIDNHPACTIIMDDYYICQKGFKWDSANQKCVQIDGLDCVQDTDCQTICSDNSRVGTCVNDKCQAGSCGTPGGIKDWLIEYMIYIMLVLMAINVILLVAQKGRVTIRQAKDYGRRNKEGWVIGMLLGAIGGLLPLGLNPISWVMVWTVLASSFLGAIVDQLWKAKI